MREPLLSRRMQTICDMVTPGSRVVDVGCDHGLVDIYLVQKGICPEAIAMDVREGPLSRARKHVEMYGLGSYIELRLSDGLKAFHTGEAQTLICAGMGGRLMGRILEESREKAASFDGLILQPQSELKEFRQFLGQEGYYILQENILEEEGKYYFLIRAIPKGKVTEAEKKVEYQCFLNLCNRLMERCPEIEELEDAKTCVADLCDRFGRILLWEQDSILLRYLEERFAGDRIIAENISDKEGERAKRRLLELSYETELYRYGIALCQREISGNDRR